MVEEDKYRVQKYFDTYPESFMTGELTEEEAKKEASRLKGLYGNYLVSYEVRKVPEVAK